MKTYIIEVAAYAPAPRRFTTRQNATSPAAAVARAMRAARKELPRKRIDRFLIDVRPALDLPDRAEQ